MSLVTRAKRTSGRKPLRTERDPAQALNDLIGGHGKAGGSKCVVDRLDIDFRYGSEISSRTVSFHGSIWLRFDDGGESLLVTESGSTPQEAFENCRHKLAIELQERARKRQLQSAAVAGSLVAPPPKRLTYRESAS